MNYKDLKQANFVTLNFNDVINFFITKKKVFFWSIFIFLVTGIIYFFLAPTKYIETVLLKFPPSISAREIRTFQQASNKLFEINLKEKYKNLNFYSSHVRDTSLITFTIEGKKKTNILEFKNTELLPLINKINENLKKDQMIDREIYLLNGLKKDIEALSLSNNNFGKKDMQRIVDRISADRTANLWHKAIIVNDEQDFREIKPNPFIISLLSLLGGLIFGVIINTIFFVLKKNKNS